MKPKPLIAGNWKLNKGPSEAHAFSKALSEGISTVVSQKIDIIIAPPFVSLSQAKGNGFYLAAQNVYWEEKGAFTGEISSSMLKELGVSYCIVGHSERRLYFNETDRMINLKAQALIDSRLIPVVCIGEKMEDRKKGVTNEFVTFQLSSALFGLTIKNPDELVIAYEPVWAIGTGVVATPEQAQAVHETIRGYLNERFGRDTGSNIRILYGGSVNQDNIAGLIKQKDINGALIGGASLDLKVFLNIIDQVYKKEI